MCRTRARHKAATSSEPYSLSLSLSSICIPFFLSLALLLILSYFLCATFYSRLFPRFLSRSFSRFRADATSMHTWLLSLSPSFFRTSGARGSYFVLLVAASFVALSEDARSKTKERKRAVYALASTQRDRWLWTRDGRFFPPSCSPPLLRVFPLSGRECSRVDGLSFLSLRASACTHVLSILKIGTRNESWPVRYALAPSALEIVRFGGEPRRIQRMTRILPFA